LTDNKINEENVINYIEDVKDHINIINVYKHVKNELW